MKKETNWNYLKVYKYSIGRKIALIFILFLSKNFSQAQQTIPIIPQPLHFEVKEGYFLIDQNTSINSNAKDKESVATIHFFTEYIKKLSGIALKPTTNPAKNIRFEIVKNNEIGPEGYTISVQAKQILIKANTSKGLFYAVQSLLQTLPAIRTNQTLQIPCIEIKDYPRFAWRGMMLDVSRHFFAPELIKEFIDLMASYKMNVFHWHLTDGSGWRLEIKKYPKLTDLAAWRVDSWPKPWNWSDIEFNANRQKATYGGYYTQEQAKEIVSFAKARNITVVPEIEMPGHSSAALAAYPEYACKPTVDYRQNGDFLAHKVDGNYCAGNDQSFAFLQDILTEVMAIFPSEYIHVGGDEVDKTSWKHCEKCQNRIKKENLKDENELQSYFIQRIEKFLVSKKRKMIGWDEILEGGLAKEATVMSWRGEAGGIEAAKMGHNVVMTPGSPLYFDHYQGDPETEPLAFGGFNTLKKVYDYEPIPAELNAEQAKFVMGSQANVWTEFIPTAAQAEYMILPRMLALSEVLWSAKDQRNWQKFNQKLMPHFKGFEQKGYNYSKGNFKVEIKPMVKDNSISIALETENADADIFYTLDGSVPTTESKKYDGPFNVNSSLKVKAVMAIDDKIKTNKPVEQAFTFNKATGKTIKYNTPNSRYYPANGANSLIDGFRGTKEIGKQWHAFNGNDMVATVDFGTSISASSIAIGCIQNWGQWVFLPQNVKFEYSEDGINFKEIKTIENAVSINNKELVMKDFTCKFSELQMKSIRITAKNIGKCPAGHPNENEPAWIFLDEIIVE